jgi:hypothetical protein
MESFVTANHSQGFVCCLTEALLSNRSRPRSRARSSLIGKAPPTILPLSSKTSRGKPQLMQNGMVFLSLFSVVLHWPTFPQIGHFIVHFMCREDPFRIVLHLVVSSWEPNPGSEINLLPFLNIFYLRFYFFPSRVFWSH